MDKGKEEESFSLFSWSDSVFAFGNQKAEYACPCVLARSGGPASGGGLIFWGWNSIPFFPFSSPLPPSSPFSVRLCLLSVSPDEMLGVVVSNFTNIISPCQLCDLGPVT